jgi:hypothetical protein
VRYRLIDNAIDIQPLADFLQQEQAGIIQREALPAHGVEHEPIAADRQGFQSVLLPEAVQFFIQIQVIAHGDDLLS